MPLSIVAAASIGASHTIADGDVIDFRSNLFDQASGFTAQPAWWREANWRNTAPLGNLEKVHADCCVADPDRAAARAPDNNFIREQDVRIAKTFEPLLFKKAALASSAPQLFEEVLHVVGCLLSPVRNQEDNDD
jgi:hypothetical protein